MKETDGTGWDLGFIFSHVKSALLASCVCLEFLYAFYSRSSSVASYASLL